MLRVVVTNQSLRLTNQTGQRIRISPVRATDEPLFLVGFGSSAYLSEEERSRLVIQPWVARGAVCEERRLPRRPYSAAEAVLSSSARRLHTLARAGEPALRSVTLVATLAIAVALPAAVALRIGPTWLHNDVLNAVLQWAAISVACVTPAAFYFLFARLRLGLVRETFLRQVLFLDPTVRTKPEAETKYQMLLDEVFATRAGLAAPVIVATLLVTAGWVLVTLPPFPPDAALPTATRRALMFGFFGAYYFALNMAFRRYLRADLNPKAYSQVVVRVLVTAILAVVLGDLLPPAALPVLAGLAFLTGVVPETGMVVIRQAVRRALLTERLAPGTEDAHPLSRLDGVNLYDRSRLLEEGIENVENLAHANLIELVLRTRIPTARLVDLFDQAILYEHLATGDEEPVEERRRLRECGIRTATDLLAARERIGCRGREELDAFLGVLGTTAGGVPRLTVILEVIRDDGWVVYLQHWRARFACVSTLDTPDQLDRTA
jgi:hypothetical protein